MTLACFDVISLFFRQTLLSGVGLTDAGYPFTCANVVTNQTLIVASFPSNSTAECRFLENCFAFRTEECDGVATSLPCGGAPCQSSNAPPPPHAPSSSPLLFPMAFGLPSNLNSQCLSRAGAAGTTFVPKVAMLGFDVEPAAFASGVNSMSTVLQVVVFISVSIDTFSYFLGAFGCSESY